MSQQDQEEGELAATARLRATLEKALPGPDSASVEEWRAIEQRLHGGRSWRFTWTAVAAAATLLVVAVFFTWLRPAASLSYRLDDVTVSARGFLTGSGRGTGRVTFSDGTKVGLLPGSRGRIATTSARGAHMTLELGQMDLEVVHRLAADWVVDAGPFVVQVTGTKFSVSWQPAAGELSVAVREGAVQVSGALAAAGVRVGPGQVLRIALRQQSLQLQKHAGTVADSQKPGATEAQQPPSTTAAVEPRAPASASSTAELPGAAKAVTQPTRSDWSALVASGDFRRVLDEAERSGLSSVLSAASSRELAALADAARYAKRLDLARKALDQQRQRFGGSEAASTAAFLMGRMSEQSGDISSALRWYEIYGAEAPAGRHAGSALGRRMLLVENTDRARAGRVAAEYLRRFPDGSYAPQARRIVDGG